jgi:hypothetical protein
LEKFSSFQVAEILKVNRNTLQSAVGSNFITPDIKRAEGRDERSYWGRNGVYRADLYFHMVRTGWPRRRAKDDSDISFENVGSKKGQFKYLIKRTKIARHKNLKEIGSWEMKRDLKEILEGKNNDLTKFIINLEQIKEEVDLGIENLNLKK